jgi:hypothetical protein
MKLLYSEVYEAEFMEQSVHPQYTVASRCRPWKIGTRDCVDHTRKFGRRISQALRLPALGTLKRYSKALEYEYRVKTAALGTLKRYSILSLTLYLE